MWRTRLTLFYPLAYLTAVGIALMAGPQGTLKVLSSNADGAYPDVLVRLIGALALVIAIMVAQIVRYEVTVLYPWILGIRVFLVVVFLSLYFETRDPAFLVLMVVVLIGVVVTSVALLVDRRAGATGAEREEEDEEERRLDESTRYG